MTQSVEPEYQRLLAAWEKADMIPGVNPTFARTDRSGQVICWLDYNNAQSINGWVMKLYPFPRKPKMPMPVEEAVHIGDKQRQSISAKHWRKK